METSNLSTASPERKALDAFLSAAIDTGLSGLNMRQAMHDVLSDLHAKREDDLKTSQALDHPEDTDDSNGIAQAIHLHIREKMVSLGYQEIDLKVPTISAIKMVLETMNALQDLIAEGVGQPKLQKS